VETRLSGNVKMSLEKKRRVFLLFFVRVVCLFGVREKGLRNEKERISKMKLKSFYFSIF
jgi:hypothetical protein